MVSSDDYPPAPRLDLVERLHGHAVADPYRWLEDPSSAPTRQWSAAQDVLARSVLDALPGRERLGARLTELLDAGAVGAPAWRGGRAFWTRRLPGQEHAVLLCGDPAEPHVLLDPMRLDPSGLTTLDAWSPSKEGSRLAYQLSVGGDEESLVRVLDVGTGEHLDGPIDRCRYSPVAWVPGGQALYYVRRLPPEELPPGEQAFHRRVYRHQVGADPRTDVEIWGAGLEITNYYGCSVSRDGRWLLVTASAGTAPRDDVWIWDLAAGGGPVAVQTGVDARCSPWIGLDGRLYLLTDAGAPRGRLCVADPADPTRWTTLLAEDAEAVLEDVAVLQASDAGGVGGADGSAVLVALRSRHAVSELATHDLGTGAPTGTIGLPGIGTVTGLSELPEGGSTTWFGWTDTTTPLQVLAYDATSGQCSSWADAPGRGSTGGVGPRGVTAEQVHFPSYDGTLVRALVLSSSGVPDTPRPTVLYGYGGFGVSLTPAYTASALAWVEAGGVWVVANLRGGSEEGEAWHRAGMREHKHNVYDDFAACADYLIDQGWTSADRLGIYGGSNGGLLVGAALTRTPSSYAAVVCSAPLLDMVRYEQFGLGRTWNDEYGTASDPEQFQWLLSYSPYHRVTAQTRYPAVLFEVFDGDSRVDPLHARKMCAALQHATTSERPVLLRTERDVGHGARSISRTTELAVDTLSFLAAHTGLEL